MKKIIGRISQYLGDYDELVAKGKTSFGKKNRVSRYGCEFESLIDNNTYQPARIVENEVVVDENWSITNGLPENYGIKDKIENLESETENKVDKVPGKNLSTNDYSDEEKEKVADHDEAIQNIQEKVADHDEAIQNIQEQIVRDKREIVGSASEEYNSLGKVEVKLNAETIRAKAAEDSLLALYNTLVRSGVTPIDARDWPVHNPQEQVIYRVAGSNSYSDYMYNGTTFICMATYSNAIDAKPESNSKNLVESGGVVSYTEESFIDVTEKCFSAYGFWRYNSGERSNSGNYRRLCYELGGTTKVKVRHSDQDITDVAGVLFLSEIPQNFQENLDTSLIISEFLNTSGTDNIEMYDVPEGAKCIVVTTRVLLGDAKIQVNSAQLFSFLGGDESIDEKIDKIKNDYVEPLKIVENSICNTTYGRIGANGAYDPSSNWRRYIFAIEPWMKKIRVIVSTNNLGVPIAFYSDMWTRENTQSSFIDSAVGDTGVNVTVESVIPNGCRCVVVSTSLALSSEDAQIFVYGDIANESLMYDILKQNPRDIYLPIIGASKYKPANENNKFLTLLHYSDIHGSQNHLERIIKFKEYYKDFIDDVIDTGDTITDNWSNPFIIESVQKADKILRVIGNHDCATKESGIYDWYAKNTKECYDRYFANYISGWNVQNIADKCYYYKDYLSAGVRLVVLDGMHYDQTQSSWLISVLASAKENSLGVIIASHFSYKVVPFDTPFQSFHNSTSSMATEPYNELFDIVDEYINAGGEFICYLTGHTHWDCCGTVENHPNQIQITIDTAGLYSGFGDTYRAERCKSFDLFNIVTFDTTLKLIKLIRVGADRRSDMSHIGCATINYSKRELEYTD